MTTTTATSQYGRASSIKKNGCGERGKRGKKSRSGRKKEEERGGGGGEEGDIHSDGIHSFSLSLSLFPRSFPDWTQGATSMAARLPACLSARLPARSPASPASLLDYLKNRIPPARNCVSRLPCLYTNTTESGGTMLDAMHVHDGAPANGAHPVSPCVLAEKFRLPIPAQSRRKTRTVARRTWGKGRRGRYLKGHDVIGRSRRVGVRGLNPRVFRESVSRVNTHTYV